MRVFACRACRSFLGTAVVGQVLRCQGSPSLYLPMALPKADDVKKLRSSQLERTDSKKQRRNSDAPSEPQFSRLRSDSLGQNNSETLKIFDDLKDVLTEVRQEISRRNTMSNIDQVRPKPPPIDSIPVGNDWKHNKPPEAWQFR